LDVIALILQTGGGALAGSTADRAYAATGTSIMVAGLSFQVISLTAFICLCAEFFWRVKEDRRQATAMEWAQQETARPFHDDKEYRPFLSGKHTTSRSSHCRTNRRLAFALATILILVRSLFRIAELAHGFQSKLANDQAAFMLLEGGVMAFATLLMTMFHPAGYINQQGARDKQIKDMILLQSAENFSPLLLAESFVPPQKTYSKEENRPFIFYPAWI
jgi:RTA1 like protein